ncbi:DUF4181 domain-containing protein [Solibacillus sp. MA9]|uniref:DUF4181 domain-containing protein n=1 Tax=Solibacillus palustris TaxID=2908203 RepID=A0ABS9UBS1_9BACL|nr:DUF4181 domain-containing protein [Solibacillus sp. MA9]MCH7321609.1 DUF4181 domain-containing protein [Solibacillus sp. MA9]
MGGFVWGLLILNIVILTLFFLLEKLINKLLGVEKKKMSEYAGKKVDLLVNFITYIIFLCTVPLSIYLTRDINVVKWYWILGSIFIFGFHSILEWKYMKNSKQYITTLILLILSVIFIYNIRYVFSIIGVM